MSDLFGDNGWILFFAVLLIAIPVWLSRSETTLSTSVVSMFNKETSSAEEEESETQPAKARKFPWKWFFVGLVLAFFLFTFGPLLYEYWRAVSMWSDKTAECLGESFDGEESSEKCRDEVESSKEKVRVLDLPVGQPSTLVKWDGIWTRVPTSRDYCVIPSPYSKLEIPQLADGANHDVDFIEVRTKSGETVPGRIKQFPRSHSKCS